MRLLQARSCSKTANANVEGDRIGPYWPDGAVQYHADGARNPKRFACRLTKERADAFGRKVSFALATGGRPRSTLRKVAAPTCANHEINRFAANVL